MKYIFIKLFGVDMIRSKLKPNYSLVGFIPAIAALLIFLLSFAIFGKVMAFKILGIVVIFYAVMNFTLYLKTQSWSIFLQTLYIACLGMFIIYFPAATHVRGKALPQLTLIFFYLTLFLLALVFYLALTRKLKWRGKEILEMTAQEIDETSGSYTDRPMPIGKVDAEKDDVLDFAAFLRKNLVSMTYIEEDKVFFVPVEAGDYPPLFSMKFNYLERTWVTIDFEGNVSAHISKYDYLRYVEEYSFDLLCKSLGEKYIEFFELYIKNEGVRVIDKMNTMKLNPFS